MTVISGTVMVFGQQNEDISSTATKECSESDFIEMKRVMSEMEDSNCLEMNNQREVVRKLLQMQQVRVVVQCQSGQKSQLHREQKEK